MIKGNVMGKTEKAGLLLALMLPGLASAASLGEINIQLRGNVVDLSCAAAPGDADKTVQLGRWATKQLATAGSTSSLVPFSLRLMGCPPGSVSITFSGRAASVPSLLALDDGSSAGNVAVEIRDGDRQRLALASESQDVVVDNDGNATLQFFANYIAISDNVTAGSANADATFMINYY
jgi:minor fimbrial subunit